MEWLVPLVVCLYLLGWAGMAMERNVLAALKLCWFPFDFTFRVLGAFWSGYKWARSKWKALHRRPAYGDARLASEQELKANFKGGSYCVGKMKGRALYADAEACVVMLGIRGSGKSSTMGATLNKASGENLLVCDPPSGLYNRFRGELEAKGYRIIKIDLNDPLEGDGYDPMAFFKGSRAYDFENAMDELARLVVIDRELDKGADTHFSEIVMNLVGALAAYLWRFKPEKASLHEVARVLSGMGRMQLMEYLAEAQKCGDDYVKVAINAYQRVEDKERGSVDSTMSRKTKRWMSPLYRDLCRKGWSWDEVLFTDKPVAVFVTGGVMERENISPIMRVIFGQCVTTLARSFSRLGRPARDTKLLIDEADLLGRCKPIFAAITEMRKVGVSCFLGYQSLSQLKHNFGQNDAGTIIDNCDMIFTGSMKDEKAYDLVRKLMGRLTVQSMQKSKAGVSESEAGQDLQGVHDLFKMAKRKHFVLLGNKGVMCDAPWDIVRGVLVYQ